MRQTAGKLEAAAGYNRPVGATCDRPQLKELERRTGQDRDKALKGADTDPDEEALGLTTPRSLMRGPPGPLQQPPPTQQPPPGTSPNQGDELPLGREGDTTDAEVREPQEDVPPGTD